MLETREAETSSHVQVPSSHVQVPSSHVQVPVSERSVPEVVPTGSRDAAYYTNKGAALKNQGKLDEAMACYKKALNIDPNHLGAHYNIGNALIGQGKTEEAIASYRKVLEIKPDYPEVYNNMGVAFSHLRKPDETMECYKKALEINPNYAEAYNNMGNALKGQNRLDEAIDYYKKALTVRPNYAEAHYNMGNTLNAQGKYEETIACYRKVLEISPNHPESYNNMGNAFKNQGKPDQAIECYTKALAIDPKNADAYYNMGNTRSDQGEFEAAVACYRKVAEMNPNYAEAFNNMGAALKNLGKLAETIEAYKGAIKASPNYAEAYNNMGLSLFELGRLDEAMVACQKAIAIKPDYADAYNNLGGVFKDQGKIEETVDAYREALKIRPDYAEVYNNMGNAVKDMGRLDEAIECYQKAMSMKSDYYKAHSNLMFALQYSSEHSPDWIFEKHRIWNQTHAVSLTQGILPHTNDRTPGRRLRVGYVSPDFRKHSCAYFIEPLFNSHDRNQVEIFSYAEVQKSDEMTERVKSLSDAWRSTLGQSDAAVAEQIRKDRIDILVDLAGHTANNRLLVFARKPAPIQVTWLGYPDTTGLDVMDYRFTDAVADPEGTADRYASETLIRLPKGFHCYTPLYIPPETGGLPFLKTRELTFTSFNNLTKVTDKTVAVWAKILQQVPHSRILLKSRQLGSKSIQRHYLDMFLENGISEERVTLVPRIARQQEHLAFYNQADIALDPFPYNGTTTSFESLWMGIPVVTLYGNRHVSRVGASILTQLGLTDLIAADEADYIAKAVQLAGDIERLSELRASLRGRMVNSSLCDEQSFARVVEAAYREMWRKWCSGELKVESVNRTKPAI